MFGKGWFFSLLFLGFFTLSSCKTAFIRTVIYNDPTIDDLKVMPYRTVKAGDTKNIVPRSVTYNQQTLPDSLRQVLQLTKTVAFLVMKHDSLVYEWYAPGYSDSSYTNPFSVTKSIMGVLTGIALKEGKIKSLDEPVADYIPEYCDYTMRENITFRHLLTMSSGMKYYDRALNPFGPLSRLYYGPDSRKFVRTLKPEKPAGTEWRYKNSDTEVLSIALRNAVGVNMSEYASEKLWQPIGAERDGKWVIDDQQDAVEKAFCCLYTNARDLAKIGLLYKHHGRVNGVQIVDSSYVQESITPVILPHGDKAGKIQKNYGYSWWTQNVDNDFHMDGMRGQYVIVLPKEDIVVVRLGKKDWHKKRFKGDIALYSAIVHPVRETWGGGK